MRSMVVVFYLQDWNLGINERSELLPPAPLNRITFYFEGVSKGHPLCFLSYVHLPSANSQLIARF
jgi:hypothetical protein